MFVTHFVNVKVYPLKNKGDCCMALSKYLDLLTSLQMDNSTYMDVSKKQKKVLAE